MPRWWPGATTFRSSRRALNATGLYDTLDGASGSFTLFAPNDAVWVDFAGVMKFEDIT